MSRVGKQPVNIPAGVEVQITGQAVSVKGPKGVLNSEFSPEMEIEKAENTIVVKRPSDEPMHRSLHGLTRTMISNMVVGVSEGFTRTLEIVGVGYKATKKGEGLEIAVGYSNPIDVEPVKGITLEAPIPTRIKISGADKQMVGEVAAKIRSLRPPEPYKGKGIKYEDERIRRKVGKTAK